MKIEVLDVQGNKVSDLELNDQVWAIEPHKQAIFDTVIAQQAAMRQATNKVKTRAEVRGGGRKPWKQKGTGRARQGSIRAPQWRGGGVAFGPTGNNNYKLSVNKKVKALAFRSALSLKAQEQNLVVIDKFSFEKPSTKKMIETLTNLKVNGQKTLIVTKDNEELVVKSGANLASVKTLKQNQMNVYDLLNANKLVVTQDAISVIEEVWG